MTTAKTTKRAAKPGAARRAKGADAATLKRLLAEAGEYSQAQSWQPLIDRWTAEEGLKITRSRGGGGPFTASLGGIRGTSPFGAQTALVNWTNAARRALRRMGEATA